MITCTKQFTIPENNVLFHIDDYGGAQPLFIPNPASDASALPEWDGTFTGVDPISPECYQFLDPCSIQGKAIYGQPGGNQIVLCVLAGFPKVRLTISTAIGAGEDHVWQGDLAGLNPAGTYNQVDGNDPRPTVTIVAG